jgi:hypothetical protein
MFSNMVTYLQADTQAGTRFATIDTSLYTQIWIVCNGNYQGMVANDYTILATYYNVGGTLMLITDHYEFDQADFNNISTACGLGVSVSGNTPHTNGCIVVNSSDPICAGLNLWTHNSEGILSGGIEVWETRLRRGTRWVAEATFVRSLNTGVWPEWTLPCDRNIYWQNIMNYLGWV